jgi:hypothetical protein
MQIWHRLRQEAKFTAGIETIDALILCHPGVLCFRKAPFFYNDAVQCVQRNTANCSDDEISSVSAQLDQIQNTVNLNCSGRLSSFS